MPHKPQRPQPICSGCGKTASQHGQFQRAFGHREHNWFYCKNCFDQASYDSYQASYDSYRSAILANRSTVVKMLLRLRIWDEHEWQRPYPMDRPEGSQYDRILAPPEGGGVIFDSPNQLHYIARKDKAFYLVEERLT